MKILKTLGFRRGGNATLISLLIMGALLTLGMGVNALLIRDIRTTADLVLAGKAYYAAEAAIEDGLLAISKHAPGFTETVSGNLDPLTRFSYTISSTGESVPVEDTTYMTLAPQESFSLPLFREIEGRIEPINRFQVLFYLQQNVGTDLFLHGGNVLRWKIVGTRQQGGEVITEAISDYVSVEPSHIVRGDVVPQHPQIFDDMYLAKYKPEKADFSVSYSVHQFLQDHENNYLVLTNVSDTAMTSGSAQLKFRLVSTAIFGSQPLVQPRATVRADGFFKEFTQSIDAALALDQFLPVFDFALYQVAE